MLCEKIYKSDFIIAPLERGLKPCVQTGKVPCAATVREGLTIPFNTSTGPIPVSHQRPGSRAYFNPLSAFLRIELTASAPYAPRPENGGEKNGKINRPIPDYRKKRHRWCLRQMKRRVDIFLRVQIRLS